MRNLLITLFLMLSSASIFGQGQPDIIVRNATSCTVYYRLFLSNAATPCTMSYASSILTLPPGTSATFSNTAFPPGAYHFIRASVFSSALSCSSAVLSVGDPACTFANTGTVNLLTGPPTCAFCYTATVDWVLGGVGSLQTVVIH